MSIPIIVQGIASGLSIVVAVLAITKWRQARMMYFNCLALASCVVTVGYLLEITAPTLEAAVLACRVQYFGNPYSGVFYYLFICDYCNISRKNRKRALALLFPPVVFMLLMQTYPLQHLFYNNLTFETNHSINYLLIHPGPFYYLSVGYNTFMGFLALLVVIQYSRRATAEEKKHAKAFFFSILIMLVPVILQFAGAITNAWGIVPVALSLNVAFLAWYLAQFRQKEWHAMGREVVVENMKDAFILLDTNHCFLDANAKAQYYFPELATIPAGTPASEVPGVAELLATQPDGELTVAKENDTYYLRVSRTPLVADDQLIGTSIMVYDDTENHLLLQELQEMATHDGLTGLNNRASFFAYATHDFDLCQRKREPASVLMIDIDHFKNVNDRYGHASGDKVLISVAETLQARLRRTDISGRYGGEELVVWLPSANMDSASMIAGVIRRAVEHTIFESDTGHFHVTISIGVATVDYDRQQTLNDVINEADNALYQAKNDGRNLVRAYIHPSKTDAE